MKLRTRATVTGIEGAIDYSDPEGYVSDADTDVRQAVATLLDAMPTGSSVTLTTPINGGTIVTTHTNALHDSDGARQTRSREPQNYCRTHDIFDCPYAHVVTS